MLADKVVSCNSAKRTILAKWFQRKRFKCKLTTDDHIWWTLHGGNIPHDPSGHSSYYMISKCSELSTHTVLQVGDSNPNLSPEVSVITIILTWFIQKCESMKKRSLMSWANLTAWDDDILKIKYIIYIGTTIQNQVFG